MFGKTPFGKTPFTKTLTSFGQGALVELLGQLDTIVGLLGQQNFYNSLVGDFKTQENLQGNIINIYQLMGNTVSTMLQGQIDHFLTLLGQYLKEEDLNG